MSKNPPKHVLYNGARYIIFPRDDKKESAVKTALDTTMWSDEQSAAASSELLSTLWDHFLASLPADLEGKPKKLARDIDHALKNLLAVGKRLQRKYGESNKMQKKPTPKTIMYRGAEYRLVSADTKKATFTIEVTYDPDKTDAESLASAADTLLETALSTAGVLDEYGDPTFGEFYVLEE